MNSLVVAEKWISEAMCDLYTMSKVKSDDQYRACIRQS